MSDQNSSLGAADSKDTANLIYILYLASIVLGITGIIGVIMAYMNRGQAPEWLQSHYTYQIHTFWKAFLYAFIGVILTVVLIGFLVLLGVLVWYIIRCVKGMQLLGKGEAVPDPKGWLL